MRTFYCAEYKGQRLWLRPDASRFVQSGAETSCPENDKYRMEITKDFHSERQHKVVWCDATALSLYVQVALRRETRETYIVVRRLKFLQLAMVRRFVTMASLELNCYTKLLS